MQKNELRPYFYGRNYAEEIYIECSHVHYKSIKPPTAHSTGTEFLSSPAICIFALLGSEIAFRINFVLSLKE
jgi:hypothetical protein